MKLNVLTENTSGKDFKSERGLSYIIDDDLPFLFDTGQSSVFIENALKRDIDLNDIKRLY